MIEKASFSFFYHSSEQQKYTFFFQVPPFPPNEMDFIKEIIRKEPLQINCDLDQWDSARFMLKKMIYFKRCYCMPLKMYFQPHFVWAKSVIFYFLKPEFTLRMMEDLLRVSWKLNILEKKG